MSSLVEQVLAVPGVLVYVIVGLLVFAEDALFVVFLIPGETAAVLGGVDASRGHVKLWLISRASARTQGSPLSSNGSNEGTEASAACSMRSLQRLVSRLRKALPEGLVEGQTVHRTLPVWRVACGGSHRGSAFRRA